VHKWGERSYIHFVCRTGSERKGKRIPGKTGSTIAASVCSLLGSNMKAQCEVTVLRVDHRNSVQKESATSEFDARRWRRNLSSLVVKGRDTRSWLAEIDVSWMQGKGVKRQKHTGSPH